MEFTNIKLNKPRVSHKGRKIAFSIFIFLAASITGGLWYWNTHKKEIIKDKIESMVLEKSKGLYTIKYDSSEVDEINGNFSLSNLVFVYDSAHFIDLKKTGKEPSILLDIQIPRVIISGLKTPRALLKSEISGRKLEIKDPLINIFYTNAGKDSSRSLPVKEIYEQILGKLVLIQADTVLISNAQIITSNLKTKKTGIRIQDVFITLVNVKIDSTSNADTSRMVFAKEVNITCGKLAWSSSNKLYNYSADNLAITSLSRDLRIKNFRMAPTMNEEAFVKALPAQGDRFDFSIHDIQMQNINLPQLFEETLVAENILIDGFSLKIYRDLVIPRDKKNRVGAYPHQVMQTIPLTFRARKVVLRNGFIEYKERHNITRLAGKIQYNQVYAGISNFTNDKKAIHINNIMTVDMSTMFLNKTKLKIHSDFYLLHPQGRFELKGSFGAMDATLLNPIIERTCMTRIKNGNIQGAEFVLHGKDYGMNGSIRLLYDDLKVTALEINKKSNELGPKRISSSVANILIKNSNPKRNDDVRVAQVYLARNTNASFFNYSWKVLLMGVMETVGLK